MFDMPEAFLRQRYIEQRLTCEQIAKEVGCSRALVLKRLTEAGIPRRRVGDYLRGRTKTSRFVLPRAVLLDRYVRQGLTAKAIADEVGCSDAFVYLRLKAEGIARRVPGSWGLGRTREKAPNWKGGRIMKNGYIMLRQPDHPAAANGYVFEHRLVMEAKLDRPLQPDEDIHHMNHMKDDNRPENLMLLTKTDHAHHHNPQGHRHSRKS